MRNHDADLIFGTQIDTTGVTQGLQQMGTTVNKTGSTIKRSFWRIGKLITAAFSVTALIKFGKEALNVASDLQEVQNVVDVSFGAMSEKIDAWSKTMTEKFGLSELSAKKFSSTFMAMGNGIGLASETSAKMATSLTERAADIASFYNITAEEASTKLKSIYTGETETLKSLGVVMTQTNLQNYAMTLGIKDNIQSLDQATLTQLRYKFVMEQTKQSMGDFERTSGSWANQTKLLKERFNELKASVGNALIQALTPVIRFINTLIERISILAKYLESLTAKIFGKQTAAASGSTDAMEELTEAQDDYADALKETEKEQKRTLASFDEINKLGSDKDKSSTAGSALDIGGLDLGTESSAASKTLSDIEKRFESLKKRIKAWIPEINISKVKNSFKNLFSTFKKMWEDIKKLKNPLLAWFNGDFRELVKSFIDYIITIITEGVNILNTVLSVLWDTIIYPVIKGIIEDILPVITQIGTEMFKTASAVAEAVSEIVQTIIRDLTPTFELVGQIVTDVFKSIHDFWDKYGAPIFEGFREMIKTTKEAILNIWNEVLKPFIDYLTETIKEIWDKHAKPVVDKVLTFIGEFILMVQEAYNFLLPILTKIGIAISKHVLPHIKSILNVAKAVINGLIDAFGGIITFLTGMVKILRGIFTGDMSKVFEGFEDIVKGSLEYVKGLFDGIINAIIALVEGGINAAIRGINRLLNPLRAIKEKTNIGFTIPDIKEITLPRLATGTVIPANYGEFAAILGDNTKEAEVVSPLSTMKQAFKEALAEMTGNSTETIILQVDGNTLAKEVIQKHNLIVKQTGRSPLKGV